jgi:purine-cytosine permease-like protein
MKYLYYKNFQIFRKIKTNDTPEFNAMIILSVCQYVNILTLLVFFNHFFIGLQKPILSRSEIVYYSFASAFVIMFINYFLLYKKREKICEKYKNESKIKSMLGYVIFLIYIIGTAALVYIISSKYPL